MTVYVEAAAPSDFVSPIFPSSKNRSWLPTRWLGRTTARAGQRLPHIVHVGIDAFFTSVEQFLNPKLAGKPVLVGRSVVTAASYEARIRGVKPAMSFAEALQICPNAIIVACQYEYYAEFAERVRRILETYTPAVEAAALDDFYLDFAATARRYPTYQAVLRRMQDEILSRTGLSASIGAARSRTVACVASRLERPRGLRIVEPGTEQAFLWPLPVEKLNGIGQIQAADLALRGISTIGQLRMVPKSALTAAFGDVIGRQIWEGARGRDTRELRLTVTPGSVSREALIEGGSSDRELLAGMLRYLNERVGSTLRDDQNKQGCVVGLQLRYVDDFSAEQTVRLTRPTNDSQELLTACKDLLTKLFTRNVPIRAMRVSIRNLEADCAQDAIASTLGVVASL